MRKWRPSFKSIYVIPEVRGNLSSLEVILNRILPLRKFKGQEDMLIMLGGYIDADEDAPGVLDALITIQAEYGARVVFIRGDHEEMMLRAIIGAEKDYQYWIQNGGGPTLEAYVRRAGLKGAAASLPQSRLKDIIPASHVEFIQSLPYSYAHEDFFFFHGGFNPQRALSETTPLTFAFDQSASQIYKQKWKSGAKLDVEKIMIGAHNYNSNAPIIFPRYFMLGGTAPRKLIVVDLNSMEACAAKRGKSRIYKTNIRVVE
jgi:hypothetical protein